MGAFAELEKKRLVKKLGSARERLFVTRELRFHNIPLLRNNFNLFSGRVYAS